MSHISTHTSAVRPRSQVGSRGATPPQPADKPAVQPPTRDSVLVSGEAREEPGTRAATSSQLKALKKNLCGPSGPAPGSKESRETHDQRQKRYEAAEKEIERLRRPGKYLDSAKIYQKHCVPVPF